MVRNLATTLSVIIHTNRKHKIQAIVTIAMVFMCYVAGLVAAHYLYFQKNPKIDQTDFNPALMDSSVRPDGDKLTNIIVPDASDEDAVIECALELYCLANYNLQHDNKVAYAVNTNTEVLKVPTGGVRYTIKNGNEFFNADYFYVPTTGGVMASIAKTASPEYTNYGYRMYYNNLTKVGREQKAKDLSYEVLEDGSILFGVNWCDLYYDNEITETPAEFASSNKDYKYYNYVWNKQTVLSATVQYFEDKGYYELVIEIDATKEDAVKDGLKALRDGAGDEEAYYTKIVETVQIWDNGRYKEFNTMDSWASPHIHGMKRVGTTYATNDYRTTFYYDDYSLNISNYQYAQEFINSLS
ncbi:MAG: hypothetical protein K5923_04120 [Clostridia bacterium]|nr:hypothetical protein [Clostridia bacterium]